MLYILVFYLEYRHCFSLGVPPEIFKDSESLLSSSPFSLCLCLSLSLLSPLCVCHPPPPQGGGGGESLEVSGQWDLASPLLPLKINNTPRMLQVLQSLQLLATLRLAAAARKLAFGYRYWLTSRRLLLLALSYSYWLT